MTLNKWLVMTQKESGSWIHFLRVMETLGGGDVGPGLINPFHSRGGVPSKSDLNPR